jgi:hypothetical protein
MLRTTTLDRLSIAELEDLCETKTIQACELFTQAAHTFDYKQRTELTIKANRSLRESSRINALILRRIGTGTTDMNTSTFPERSAPSDGRTVGYAGKVAGIRTGGRRPYLFTALD